MATTTSSNALHRIAGFAFMLLLCLCLCAAAEGQGSSPLVTASTASGLSHPSGWGVIQQTAIDANGDLLVVDFANGALYEFPAGGGAAITLVPPAGLGSIGGYQNPALLIDPANNVYVGANWNNCLLEYPYDAKTQTWDGLSDLTASNPSTTVCPNSTEGTSPYVFAHYNLSGTGYPGYFQPWGVAVGNSSNMIIGAQNSGNFIFSLQVNGAWSNPTVGNLTMLVATLKKRAVSVAQDPEGNVYFVEDSSGGAGVYEIPAGTTGLADESTLSRIDPGLDNATGVISDAAGNLYMSDSTLGIFLVPNPSGTPQTGSAIQLSPVPAVGEIAIDWARNILYVPTNQQQSNGEADVAMVQLNFAEFGASAIGKASASGAITYSFQGNATPSRFVILQDGQPTPDFQLTGGTCATGTAYAAMGSCTEVVTFTPSSVGSVSANLLMQTAQPLAAGATTGTVSAITGFSLSGNNLMVTAGNTLVVGELVSFTADKSDPLYPLNGLSFNVLSDGLSASQFEIPTSAIDSSVASAASAATVAGYTYTTVSSMLLHGTGTGANMQSNPALEATIGGSLSAPTQVALDSQGNAFVADPGLKKVLMYAAGSDATTAGVSIGTGLKAPTGIAVDGGGDIFIADSGNVYEIPSPVSGLNTAGGQLTLASGLGANLKLATDTHGNLYVADPANARVVKFSNLGASGIGLVGQSQTSITSGLTTPSSVAVDSSNNLYVIDGANLFEFMGGIGSPVTLLNALSGAAGVAVDASGAIYLSSNGGTVRIPSIGGVLTPASQTSLAVSVTNPTAIALDKWNDVYLADGGALDIHVVTTSGSLDLGTLPTVASTSTLPITLTNEGNGPLNITGYTSTNAIDFTASDVNCETGAVAAGATCQADVTFSPGPGEEGPLGGQIGFTSDAANGSILVAVKGVGAALAPSLSNIAVAKTAEVVNTPVTVTVAPSTGSGTPTGTVTVSYMSITGPATTDPMTLTNGTATMTLAPVAAGSQKFTVNYNGDRIFGRSTITISAVIAKSASAMAQPTTPPPFLPYVLESNGSTPYDGSVQYWQYNYTVTVSAAVGQPTGQVTFNDDSKDLNYSGVACPQSSAGVQTVSGSGQAIFPAACLPMPQNVTYTPIVSTHTVTAVYAGDANFLSVTGPAQTFIAVRSPAVKIAASTSSLSLSSGSSATVNLTLTEMLGYGFAGRGGLLNNYDFPVTLSCSNLPPHTSCAFSYPNPDPGIPTAVDMPCPTQVNGSAETAEEANSNCTPGQATVTLVTDVSGGTTTSRLVHPATVAYGAVFGFGLFGLFFRRRLGKAGRMFLMLCLALAGCALSTSITACSTTNLSPASVLTTPSGTYSVTITAEQVGQQCIAQVNGQTNCTTGGGQQGKLVYGSQNQISLPFTLSVTVQ
ncbi:MAG TPA: Ig-like domain repeat protein [Terracidiphilus sp.]|jgi:hypothetical protein|nr:Ig-like domain repeat protein [Terracidiphilus sp.]